MVPVCMNSCVSCDDVQDQGEGGENYSMVFDGGDDYIEVPHNSSLNISETGNQYYGSVMAWVNLNYSNLSENDWPRIVSKKTFWNSSEGFEFEVLNYQGFGMNVFK